MSRSRCNMRSFSAGCSIIPRCSTWGRRPQLEITDPMGLVYSQAVENADRSLRFTLNGSLAAQSLTSRFIQNYFGAGVQHIAFATRRHLCGSRARAGSRACRARNRSELL